MTLKALEQTLRRMVQGGRFRGPVHPLEVARGLSHAMVMHSQPGLVGQVAPNDFVVSLHPGEETSFVALGDVLHQEIFHYLAADAHARDLRWIGPVRFSFVADPDVPSGTFRIDARMPQPAMPSVPNWRDVTLQTPVLTGLSGFAQGQVFAVRLPHCVLGRDAACDVRIGDPKVSHRHAAITWSEPNFMVEDLNSTAGTFCNDARITAPTPLQQGDRLGLGHSVLRFDIPALPKKKSRRK